MPEQKKGAAQKGKAEDKTQTLALSVKKEDLVEWYPEVILKAQLADYSPVKGCMVIRPNGYAVWEAIQQAFNERLRALKVRNAYFPLFIPESFFKKESEHATGFTPEVAWIADTEEGERLAVRPTSETIMYDMYATWIRSYRDLPLRINQWCNVVRWETKATKLFLRTREFLWQEGHCVYETKEQCDEEVLLMINEYKALVEGLLAVPVIVGKKTKYETFAGADYSLTIEAFMPDGKALQSGTSHNLGQGFAKSFGIGFLGRDGEQHIPWQSSWGFSTRLLGAMVMTHGDDKGIVLPPAVAPIQAVIVPIIFDKTKEAVLGECRALAEALRKDGIRVELDDRDEYSSGWKFNDWELKGVPLRIELGPKDLENKQVMLAHRHSGRKHAVSMDNLADVVKKELEQTQHEMLAVAKKRLADSIVKVASKEDFMAALERKKLVLAPFCCDKEAEEDLKAGTGGATTRCIPLDAPEAKGERCVWTGKPAAAWVYFAKAY